MAVEINSSLVSSIVGGRHNRPLDGERRSFVQQAADRERGREEPTSPGSPEETKDNEAIPTTETDSSEGAAQHAPLDDARADLRDETECGAKNAWSRSKALKSNLKAPRAIKALR